MTQEQFEKAKSDHLAIKAMTEIGAKTAVNYGLNNKVDYMPQIELQGGNQRAWRLLGELLADPVEGPKILAKILARSLAELQKAKTETIAEATSLVDRLTKDVIA